MSKDDSQRSFVNSSLTVGPVVEELVDLRNSVGDWQNVF